MSVKPRTRMPSVEFSLLEGGAFRLADAHPKNFTMLVVYRGLHCPICKGYLGDLNAKIDKFAEKGTDVVVVSSDSRERVEQAKKDWGLDKLKMGYGLDLDAGRQLGLFVSSAIRDGEPPQFLEPGLFVVRPDGTLYCSSVQTMPFARAKFDDILMAIDFVVARNYPARGEA